MQELISNLMTLSYALSIFGLIMCFVAYFFLPKVVRLVFQDDNKSEVNDES